MLLEALGRAVGAEHVVTDPELRAAAEVDWTGRWRGEAMAVVRPGTPAEVAAVLRLCADAGVPVVPQGGNTGLVGGSVPGPAGGGTGPVGGAVVVQTRRLAGLEPVATDGTVVVGAGGTLAAVQRHAAAAGRQLGLDWAARDTATIGGAVATNAGGLRVLRWGPARAQLVGAEVALSTGALLSRVDGPLKDSTGYDLSGLLCGSEGTLGVLTRVRLRLVAPLPADRAVALVGVRSVADAQTVLADVRRAGLDLAAAELIGAAALDLLDGPAPLPDRWAAYVLLEVVGGTAPDRPGGIAGSRSGGAGGTAGDRPGGITGSRTGGAGGTAGDRPGGAGPGDLAPALAEALAGTVTGDAVLAADPADRARLWRHREEITPAVSRAGMPVKLDVSVPAERLAEVWAALDAPGTVLFGHLAEANLHVNVLGAADGEAVADRVLRLVAAAGGSISAEHGIGRAKTRWLPLTRSAAELAAMRAVKAALDPTGILNPGVLLP